MGFGDLFHKHPVSRYNVPGNSIEAHCFHCELPVADTWSYSCNRCDFYVHQSCNNLPETIRHPLHHQHSLTLLTLFASSSDPMANLCNRCQKPCLEGFAYHCPTCQFILHIKCCFNLDHEKHYHPLIFKTSPPLFTENIYNCSICGYPVKSFNFACTYCMFFVHYDCSIIPPTIKHHHTHELTIRHNFPEECDQVYCDMCEDRDGELDRALSYYYCKRCDYIAHVRCITQPKEDAMLFKRFTHEHPVRLTTKNFFCCNQCNYAVQRWSEEYPSLIKHPRHPEHTLAYVEEDHLSRCTNCEFTLDITSTFWFTHPYLGDSFLFHTKTEPFRCDVCGEFGKGSRMKRRDGIDLHLECFALPGKLDHESHPHQRLYLSSNPAAYSFTASSTSLNCNVCNNEIDEKVWIYCCLDCDYVAHLTCVANDLLSTLRSSIKNQPDFCAIIEPDETSFEFHISQISPRYDWPPAPLLRKPIKSKGDNDDDAKCFTGTTALPEE